MKIAVLTWPESGLSRSAEEGDGCSSLHFTRTPSRTRLKWSNTRAKLDSPFCTTCFRTGGLFPGPTTPLPTLMKGMSAGIRRNISFTKCMTGDAYYHTDGIDTVTCDNITVLKVNTVILLPYFTRTFLFNCNSGGCDG
jgi:hypothetical protein